MISQIIYTIIMALGVASGTKATSNTFYDAKETKPTQRAVQHNNYTLYWTITANYDDPNTKYWGYKQYLRDTQSTTTTNQGRNVILDPFLIENTAYTISYNQSQSRDTWNYVILKFTNYTNSVQQITLNATATYQSSGINSYMQRIVYESTDQNLDSIIDLTLNTNTKSTLDNVIYSATKTKTFDYGNWFNNNTSVNVQTETPEFTLNESETKYIIIYNWISITQQENYGWMLNNTLQIEGNYIQRQITQEIVDIPSLMFTIISLPFSFISTAFNLTIFPNTPYAVNFSNLFMVLLSAFVLMWIIRKVFH